MLLTKENLVAIFNKTSGNILGVFVSPLNAAFEKYGIDTPIRISAFLAQVGHESNGLNARIENLNYSAQGLLSVFKKYFDEVTAQEYARKPEKIANRVYANRMGNGSESSGDGWRFKGRGLIQVTGHNNYTALASDLNITIEDTIAYLETPEGAAISAGWFWNKNNLNDLADQEDITTITKKINGGLNGIDERKRIYELAKSALLNNKEVV